MTTIKTYPPSVLPERQEESVFSKDVVIITRENEPLSGAYCHTKNIWIFYNYPYRLGDDEFRWHYALSWEQANQQERDFTDALMILRHRLMELKEWRKDMDTKTPAGKLFSKAHENAEEQIKAAIEVLEGEK